MKKQTEIKAIEMVINVAIKHNESKNK